MVAHPVILHLQEVPRPMCGLKLRVHKGVPEVSLVAQNEWKPLTLVDFLANVGKQWLWQGLSAQEPLIFDEVCCVCRSMKHCAESQLLFAGAGHRWISNI